MDKESAKSEVATQKPRDNKGHFIAAVKNQVNVSKGHDDEKLINIEVNNPLQKIANLLEDIKRQKAFQFTLKGSLGIMGVVLSLSVLGIFGTTHMLCDKGIQTQTGYVKVLQAAEGEEDLALWGKIKKTGAYFKYLFAGEPMPEEKTKPRVILVTATQSVIQVLGVKDSQLNMFTNQSVYATGKYDSCTQRLQISKPENVELAQ